MQTIGAGNFGQASLLVDRNDNRKQVVKKEQKFTLENTQQVIPDSVYAESKLALQLQSKYLVHVFHSDIKPTQDGYTLTTYMEYCPNGNLFENKLNKLKHDNPEVHCNQILSLAVCILNSLYRLTQYGMVHRDLKPANIMLSGSTWKLGDFGFLINVGPDGTVTTNCGTPSAPFLLLNLSYLLLIYPFLGHMLHQKYSIINGMLFISPPFRMFYKRLSFL